jgi:hypothetical protein
MVKGTVESHKRPITPEKTRIDMGEAGVMMKIAITIARDV